MKTILATLFSLVSFFAFSQSNDQFRLVGSGTWSTVNDSTYQSTVSFMSDLTGGGFLATQIADTFRLFTGAEKIYRVDTVWSKTFSSATMRVVEYNGTNGAPSGQVMVYDPDGRSTIPQVPFGSTGATAQLQAAVVTYNAKQDLIVADDDYGDISVLTGVWNIDANTVGNNEMANDAIGSAEVINRSIALVDLANDATISGNANTASDTLTNAFQKIIVDLNDGSIATRNNATTTQRTLANGFNVMLANATASTGGTFTPDLSTGAVFKHTVSSGSTLTVANATNNASGRFGNIYRTILKNSSGGSLTVSFGTAYLEQDWTQASNLTLANTDSIIIDWKSEFKGGAYVLTAMSDLGGGGGISDGDKGDIDVTASGLTWNIDTSAVTTLEILDATVAWADLAQAVKDSINAGGSGGSLPSGFTNGVLTYVGGSWVADSTLVVGTATIANALTVLPTDQDFLTIARTWNYGAGNGHTFEDETIIDKTGTVAYGSYDASARIRNYTYDHYTSHQARPNVENTASMTTLYGFNSIPTIAGTVTNNYGLYSQDYGGGGTVTNNIGLKVTRVLNGTNKWAIMADSAMELSGAGNLRLNAYGGGSFATTPTYVLGVNSWGDVKEITPANLVNGVIGSNNAKGVGSASLLASWGDADSLTYSPSIYVDNTNSKIGIGYTTAPPDMLSIQNTGTAAISIKSNNNVSHNIYSYNTSPSARFTFNAAQGTYSSPTILGASKYLGLIDFNGYDGASMIQAGGIYMITDGTPSSGNMPSKMVFQTRRSSFGGATDKGAIDNRGRWGFGTSSPGYWMDVVSNFNAATALLRLQNSADSVKAFVYNTANPNTVITGRPGDFLFSNNTSKGALYIKGGSTSSSSDWNQTITNSGNTTGATMTIGSDDAFGVNVETNNTARLRLDSGGRFFNGTLTDVVLTPSDSMKISGATVDIAGVVKITGAAAHVGDVDMNSYDFTEVDSLTSAGTITINSTASQIPLQVVGSFHSLSEFRSPNASGNAGIYLGNSADDNNTYGFYRIGNGNLILSMSNDYPFASEDDSIFHYNASTRVIDFRTSAIHLNGSPLAGTVGGAGQTNKIAYWTASGSVGFESSITVDSTNNRLGLGTATPDKTLGLGDGTDEFSISTASDKLTVWNDVSTPVAVVTIDSAGTLDAKGLKINGASILDGTWTPTLTNTLNVSASTAYACNYVRVGNTVTVSGRVDVDATSTGSVLLEMSLPIASDFAAFENAGGTAAGTTGTVSAIYASHTNDRLVFAYTAAVTTNEPLHFSATYRIL